jgi:hypothetical protein
MNARVILIGLSLVPPTSIAAETLNCHVGPIELRIGLGKWQVTSCDDGRSLAFATVAGNPAMPAVLFVLRNAEKAHITGEGTGDKQATSAAFEQLKSMTEAQFDALVEVTKLVKAP